MSATAAPDGEKAPQQLAESLKRFCRSVELCDNYERGYSGLKMVTDRLLESPAKTPKRGGDGDGDGVTVPEQATVERLNKLAIQKLGEISRQHKAREK